MEQFISFFVIALLFSPAVSSMGVLLSFKKLDFTIYKVSIFFSIATLFFSFCALVLFFYLSQQSISVFANSFFVLYVTPLSVVVSFFVSLVSLVIHLYSVKYMYDDEGYARYFILLDLMIFVIFGLLNAGNIILIAAFWHMVGIILYFLLVHNFRNRQTYKFGFYTLFTHLLADIPFLLAIYLIYNFYNTADLKIFLEAVVSQKELFFPDTSISVPSIVALLVIFAAMIKSAQFPFHIWLPFTLEGPNPISALMHAGVVNAGAFIANRFAPLFLHGSIALHVALVVGFITAILGSSMMLMQNDIKKALAYSTVGQMGYMMLEIGSGAFALAIYHMMVHGIFKASLFLGSGGAIHEARNEPNISNESGFSIFDSKTKQKRPSIYGYLFFVMFIPMIVAFLIFSVLLKENSSDSTMLFYLFAWVGGAQAIYTMFHARKRFKALIYTTLGFAFSLFVYVGAEHFFGGVLYRDRAIFTGLFRAASWGDATFFMYYGIVFAIVVLAWIFSYQKLLHHKSVFSKFEDLYDFVYRVFGREFYILDFCSYVSRKFSNMAKFINYKVKY